MVSMVTQRAKEATRQDPRLPPRRSEHGDRPHQFSITPWVSHAEPSYATMPKAPEEEELPARLSDVELPLNGEWTAHYSERMEKIYFEHRTTGFTCFDRPPRDAPPGWCRLVDKESARFYWYNVSTRETTWQPVMSTGSKLLQVQLEQAAGE
jgi:hypothetical protein